MTDFSQYVQYWCPICHENCINRADHPATEANRCKQCYSLSATDTTSEGTGEQAGPDAQATPLAGADEHPGPERERQSRSEPARPPGSAPLRGDPEARASSPNPAGEGLLHTDEPGDSDGYSSPDGQE